MYMRSSKIRGLLENERCLLNLNKVANFELLQFKLKFLILILITNFDGMGVKNKHQIFWWKINCNYIKKLLRL